MTLPILPDKTKSAMADHEARCGCILPYQKMTTVNPLEAPVTPPPPPEERAYKHLRIRWGRAG